MSRGGGRVVLICDTRYGNGNWNVGMNRLAFAWTKAPEGGGVVFLERAVTELDCTVACLRDSQ